MSICSAVSLAHSSDISHPGIRDLSILFRPGPWFRKSLYVVLTSICIAPCDCTISINLSFTPAGVVNPGRSTVKATPPQFSYHRLRYLARSSVGLQDAVHLGNERGKQKPDESCLLLVASSSFPLDPPKASLLGIP